MNIEISERQAPHGWVVHLDDWNVNFKHLQAAQDFVSLLQARIDAPHVWPSTFGESLRTAPVPRRLGVASVE
ncbi:hypothetical protein PSH79_12565 [Pseudomonas sp. FP2196]|uniref:hypothetical protein n=1 Tax=Pseudomonas sp. FP2196 TaxID=2954086 RepID=UPI0027374CAD|nr:hypothetical protein [Pseudomonas sp. FP2196]WLH38079.1 hypothetical protein PSH79_12565 [Pseudomonas sp. FP2196]